MIAGIVTAETCAIAADVESAKLARARGQGALARSIDEQVQCGRSALRRHTEMQERREAEPSGVHRVAEYSWVSEDRRRAS